MAVKIHFAEKSHGVVCVYSFCFPICILKLKTLCICLHSKKICFSVSVLSYSDFTQFITWMTVMAVRLISFRDAQRTQAKITAWQTHSFSSIKLVSYIKQTYFACIFYLILWVAGVVLTRMTSCLLAIQDIKSIYLRRNFECIANTVFPPVVVMLCS